MKELRGLFVLLFLASCRFEKGPLPTADYPREVGNILITKCAISGCHTPAGSVNAAGLDLSTWQNLFKGSRSGAAVVPYSPESSFLCNFINTYPDIGPTQSPVMPPNAAPLTREEVLAIREWISNGAPDLDGNIAFPPSPTRKKVYVVNQGCDVMSVIDVESGLLMRSIPVGVSPAVEIPHRVNVRPDGKYGYIAFLQADFLQYFDAETDRIVGEIPIGPGEWNTIVFSPDSRYAFVADFNPDGKIACVDLQQHKLIQLYQGSGFLVNPHGQAYHPSKKELWVAPQYGNFIYRLDVTDPLNPSKLSPILLDYSGVPTTSPGLDPHEIIFSPDGKYVFATCQGSNDLRIVEVETGIIQNVIATGLFPQEMDISTNENQPWLAITCMEDSVSFPNQGKGSLLVMDWKTLQSRYSLYPGFQPHGVAVDAEKGEIWVANRNVSPGGPAPHHTAACSGTAGFMNRFSGADGRKLNGYPIWLSVDPYSVGFKK